MGKKIKLSLKASSQRSHMRSCKKTPLNMPHDVWQTILPKKNKLKDSSRESSHTRLLGQMVSPTSYSPNALTLFQTSYSPSIWQYKRKCYLSIHGNTSPQSCYANLKSHIMTYLQRTTQLRYSTGCGKYL